MGGLFAKSIRKDLDVANHLLWHGEEGSLPPGISLKWLGAAGFSLSYQGSTILIDPYLSRHKRSTLFLGKPLIPLAERILENIDHPKAILLGHTHFDHAADVPFIARWCGCKVYGSSSAGHLMALHGLQSQMEIVVPYRPYMIEPFKVTFIPSLHSRLICGLAAPLTGDIDGAKQIPLTMRHFRCGAVYALQIEIEHSRLFHLGSAAFIEVALGQKAVDVLLVCISGRRFFPRFTSRLLRVLSPKIIVPHHFDDFFEPPERGLKPLPMADLDGFIKDVQTTTGRLSQARTLPFLKAIQTC